MRVLIADDDPRIRGSLAAQIRADGLDVIVCGNGAEALRLSTGPDAPSLVVLDWVLPDHSGPDVCRLVRSAGRTLIPYIIILTVKKAPSDVAEALDAGANDYVTKPFSMMEVRARIRVGCRWAELQQLCQQQGRRTESVLSDIEQLRKLLPVCSQCRSRRDDASYWQELETYLAAHAHPEHTRGVCPACVAKLRHTGRATTDEGVKAP